MVTIPRPWPRAAETAERPIALRVEGLSFAYPDGHVALRRRTNASRSFSMADSPSSG